MVFHKARAGTEPGVLRGSDSALGYTSQSSGQPPLATENNPILHWSPLKNADDQPSRNLHPLCLHIPIFLLCHEELESTARPQS